MALTWIKKISNKVKQYSTLVMFEHTIFSLSFGLVSMVLAGEGKLQLKTVVLVLIALVSARTGANAINRVIDAEIDAKNPRTKTRQLPRKILTKKEVIIFTTICFTIMVISAFLLNPLCAILSPIAIFMMITYSYTKRFTWACHLYLGITCAMAPMGAWIAVTGSFNIVPLFLSGANALWVAGFDIIYGSQDLDFDKENNIYSIPRKFGIEKGLYIAQNLHLYAVIFLFIVGSLSESLDAIYYVGVVLISLLLIYEHKIVSPTNLIHAKIAAYNVNQVVSVVFFVFSIVSIIVNL